MRFSRAKANAVADELESRLASCCTRIAVAGSLRRLKEKVSDVELLFVSRVQPRPETNALFGTVNVALADEVIQSWLNGLLSKRPNVNGSPTWGPLNKLAVHLASGIPVDLFATTDECWFNALVCRTGSAETNMKIAAGARRRGLKWHPYGKGFTYKDGTWLTVTSEREVFEAAGLPYIRPEWR
jgi:DNA polymerase/3'-5' exonuclease PolX